MGVYARFKKDPEGFRHLVELLESTPLSRRKKMIDVGMLEDPSYTEKALSYVLSFQDVLELNDLELAEVIAEMPGRLTGYAVHSASEEVKSRFISKAQPKVAMEIREALEESNVGPAQIGGGQTKMIETTRKLERKGLIQKKRIPVI